jgi:hypothetical protein
MISGSNRALPDFLLLGTQRGGTTSVFNALTDHSDVRAPTRKEIHFLDRFWRFGETWYRAHFPIDEPDRPWLTGEATADYLFAFDAPKRAKALMPDVRLVALLRDPVERAFSAWKLMTRKGRERRTFADAVADELAGGEVLGRGTVTRRLPFAYLARGDYGPQIQRWRRQFRREQLLLLTTELLFGSERERTALEEFLGLPGIPAFPHLYSSGFSEVPGDVARRLRPWSEQIVEDVTRLIGREPPW